ncbi:WYL domain-containing protein [Ihubacter massiliensis]|uniref:WYL domain-containing protein n=1 Tax=Hominibacterium faecale TaxID=2839743 RepID=A0A9J6QVT0_9FIRM|nr:MULTISPECIES: WYL domain-containing protein [Eubacteriales Family XIII. Incertae Sedis]MCO7121372.1 WYL domain-containing protein [Ihubacter massiliensis]MCU7378358.1 WYL domain-containing protein [Hominibacterium faecale]
MLFHEIYGCYYNTVARILKEARKGTVDWDAMRQIVSENAFSESFLTIEPALKKQEWKLIDEKGLTPLKHDPSLPVSLLQKRWLKAISLDPRIQLFDVNFEGLEDIEPLFTPQDYVVFDQYDDGDPYDDQAYRENFRMILDAINNQKQVHVIYENRKGSAREFVCVPYQMEYSEKDDKFRALVAGTRYADIVNIARIKECRPVGQSDGQIKAPAVKKSDYFVLELTDERNALERVMLHFAHFQKEAEQLSDHRYRLRIDYQRDDETELVIRVLSFGPMVKVTEPASFVERIKERLMMQKDCGL